MGNNTVDEVIGAIRSGLSVLLPTDTVYGLAAGAEVGIEFASGKHSWVSAS